MESLETQYTPPSTYVSDTSSHDVLCDTSKGVVSVSQDLNVFDHEHRPLLSHIDIAQLVQKSYDEIAPRYLQWSIPSPARLKYLGKLLEHLPEGATVLELGCRAGKACTQVLTEHAEVTGVDISAAQLALAKQLVPKAHLIQADMMSLNFPKNSYDAVTAFYSVIHLPREQHHILLQHIND